MSGFSEIVKLNPIELSGHVTVELFDALTGKMQEQIKGKNFISVKAAELLRRMQIAALTAGVAKYSVGQPVANGYYSYNGSWFSPFFQYLVLTDYASAEASTTDTLVRGNVKGYCNYAPSVDTSLLAGYANQEEAWAIPSQAHMVFDFATDKANGTFRSIYLASSYTPGIYNGEYKKTFKCKAVRNYGNTQYSGGYFWGKVGNIIYKISMTTGEEVASYDMLETVYAFTVNSGFLYYLPAVGTTLKRYQFSGGEKTTLTITRTSDYLFNDGTYIYTFYGISGNANHYINRITISTFTMESNKDISPPDGQNYYGWQYGYFKGGVMYAVFYDNAATVDAQTGYRFATIDYAAGTCTVQASDWYPNIGLFTDGTYDYVFLSNAGFMGSGSYAAVNYGFYTTDILATGNYNIFSRKLLSADVTKANNQTMKISYDIFIS